MVTSVFIKLFANKSLKTWHQTLAMAVYTEKFLKIIKKLLEKPESHNFRDPVDYKGLGLPNYLDIVKVPMDLGTVKGRLEKKYYKSNAEVKYDLDLIWNNCQSFNMTGSEIYEIAELLRRKCDGYIAKDAELSHAIASEREKILPRDALKKRAPNSSFDDAGMGSMAPPPHVQYVQDAGTLSVKVQLFKKLRELEPSKLREVVQELIQRYPKCIKEIDVEGLKLRLDDLTSEQLKEIIMTVDGVIGDQNKDAKGNLKGAPTPTNNSGKEKLAEGIPVIEI